MVRRPVDLDSVSTPGGEEVANKKIQVLALADDESNGDLRSLLEDQGFSVVAASERKSLRYKRHARRKVPVATLA